MGGSRREAGMFARETSPDGLPGEVRFWLSSRGDRVPGRSIRSPTSGAPLVVILSHGGSAEDPLAESALAAWSEWATIAAFDLPLCGERESEKLTVPCFDEDTEVGRRLWPDLEAQARADLEAVCDALADDGAPRAVGVVAAGRGARLLARSLRDGIAPFRAVLLDRSDGARRDGLRVEPVPERPDEAWLDRAADFLRRGLG